MTTSHCTHDGHHIPTSSGTSGSCQCGSIKIHFANNPTYKRTAEGHINCTCPLCVPEKPRGNLMDLQGLGKEIWKDHEKDDWSDQAEKPRKEACAWCGKTGVGLVDYYNAKVCFQCDTRKDKALEWENKEAVASCKKDADWDIKEYAGPVHERQEKQQEAAKMLEGWMKEDEGKPDAPEINAPRMNIPESHESDCLCGKCVDKLDLIQAVHKEVGELRVEVAQIKAILETSTGLRKKTEHEVRAGMLSEMSEVHWKASCHAAEKKLKIAMEALQRIGWKHEITDDAALSIAQTALEEIAKL